MEKIMTTMHNSEARLEVHELKDELSETELKNVFGGKASFNDLSFTRRLDKASPLLMQTG
jgi:type VI protein secretion system component Hcp